MRVCEKIALKEEENCSVHTAEQKRDSLVFEARSSYR